MHAIRPLVVDIRLTGDKVHLHSFEHHHERLIEGWLALNLRADIVKLIRSYSLYILTYPRPGIERTSHEHSQCRCGFFWVDTVN